MAGGGRLLRPREAVAESDGGIMPINIPALCPYPVGDPTSLSNYVCSQPIIQLKELEVDRVRHDIWKASLTLAARKAAWAKKNRTCKPTP